MPDEPDVLAVPDVPEESDVAEVADVPRQVARTRRYSVGVPRAFSLAGGGGRVAFLRTLPDDPSRTGLWAYDLDNDRETLVAEGVSGYCADRAGRLAVVSRVDGGLAVVGLEPGAEPGREPGEVPRALPVGASASEPRIDPSGRAVAYLRDGALRVIGVDGSGDRALLAPGDTEGPDVSYGRAEFVAWMSMNRDRGFWWSPDGSRLIATRVDERPVPIRYASDPARPELPPRPIRYPAVGEPNAVVTLHVVDVETGQSREVDWDRERFEYVAAVEWSTETERPLAVVQARDQRTAHVLEIDPATGATSLLRELTDPHWIELVPGTPTRTASGALVLVEVFPNEAGGGDTYRLTLDGEPVTLAGIQVWEVLGVDGDAVLISAQRDPLETHVYRVDPTGGLGGRLRRISDGPGVFGGQVRDGTTLLSGRTPAGHRTTVPRRRGDRVVERTIRSYAEKPVLEPEPEFLRVGERDLAVAVFRPTWWRASHAASVGALPVLLDPYAGPGLQVVQRAANWHHVVSQWFAEHGFVVLSIDGRGTPGRGPAFERAVAGDIVRPVLEDQVDGLRAVAALAAERGLFGGVELGLDLNRVGIRGWSYGGFLAACAVLHRPDVFRAAVVGAALSDQRFYDTYWKERFLGSPTANAEAYRACSLLPYAGELRRPILLVQGLSDTNVWPLHALRFSAALLAAGKPHSVIPLAGQGHRVVDEDLAAKLPWLELDFLRRELGVRRGSGPGVGRTT